MKSSPLISQSVTVEKETPLEVDPGLLLVTDLNPIDEESYKFVSYLPMSNIFYLSAKTLQ